MELCANKHKGGLMRLQVLKKLCKITRLMISDVWFIIIIIIIIIINSIWSEAQSHLPKNIYNFTIRYINNSLPTCKNMARLTVGFESNLNNNAVHKKEKYQNLINEMSRNYRCVRFVNLSMSSLGFFCDECSTFLDMMNDIGIDKKQQRNIIKKMINIAIRATYYIFCCSNRNWDSPDLMQFWIFFFWLFFVVFLFFVFSFLSSNLKQHL